MTTGLAIATPQDNGAVWAIAQNMRSQAAAWQTVASGLNRAQSIVDVAASGASNIANILNSVKADALSLSDTSLDANSQATLMANIQQLVSQIDQVASSATFDGVNLLVPITEPPIPLSFPSGGPNPTLSFTSAVNGQPGIINMGFSFYNVDPATPSAPTLNSAMYVALPTTSGQTTTLSASFPYGDWSNFSATNPSSVSFDFATNQFPTPAPPAPPPPAAYGVTVQSLTLTPFRTEETVAASPDGATDSLYYQPMTSDWLGLSDLNSMTPGQIVSAVNSAISQVTANAQQIGDQQDMLTNQVNVANTMQDTITTGVGNLVDANMATESANLQAEKVKQQLATKALSIANAEPQMLLSLFR